ncbi:MAG: peptidoglycan editing factor PgeF [Pseudomonadaceae bacterium]|nr:MAG: peptidoglycan editing factor PgeF [Pseudomonadaceae bacterium]
MTERLSHSLTARWPALPRVRTCITTRLGGVSGAPWDSFNLATHVGDDAQAVAANRAQLEQQLDCQPAWLQQSHSTRVVAADPALTADADAQWTASSGIACAVLTADCLPVLLTTVNADRVAAAHAGWRGLADGVVENTLAALDTPGDQILAWLGPAIGPQAFEVGEDVIDAFVSQDDSAWQAFEETAQPGKYLANIYQLARMRLKAAGVQHIYGGDLCTVNDRERFYSYRRDGETGRMASLIWLADGN